MSKQKIILLGGGGHCKSCIDVIEQTSQYDIVGILDSNDLVGSSVLGYNIIGTDDDVLQYKVLGCQFLITVGQIKLSSVRKKLFENLSKNQVSFAKIISPYAYVSKYAKIGIGTIIMHGVVINADVTIGDNCIINTGCIIEHDAMVGHNTHISTSALVNGGSKIGEENFIGSNATISNHVVLTEKVVIGAGAVVIKDVIDPGVYVGNPIKRIM